FFRITFPLVGPGLVPTAIFVFIQAWNEYIVAYVLLSSPNNQALTIWLASFTTNHGLQWGPLMAGATLTGVPVVVFFLVLQRYLAGGLTAGDVKGLPRSKGLRCAVSCRVFRAPRRPTGRFAAPHWDW